MSAIDVSVVLNMHREALLLAPTLRSLQACAKEAAESGIVVELVAVFDRADDETRQVFRSYDLSAFCNIQEVEVDVGSLGLARNAGIERARGEYVWTSDADDLMSSNCITALLETARQHPHPKVAVFVEYLCAFGEQYHNVRYVGSDRLTAADFAFQHPYVSRIFINRSVFDSLHYGDLRVTSGFAYEDWFFNCELRAMGYDMAVAPDTVFFYRQRPGSLLRQANAASVRLIPHSKLFEVDTFLADMRASRKRVGDWDGFMRRRRELFDRNNTESFMESEKLMGFLWDAIELEPEIEPHRVETAGSYSPIPWDSRHWGVQLENLFRLLGSRKFTDIVLVPWLKPGGAEKYILQVLGEISALDSAARILVIAGEAAHRHEWVSELPRHTVFIDIYNSFPSLTTLDRDAMLVRAMLAIGTEEARLHVKSSVFAHRMLDTYGPVLMKNFKTVYYRFSDGTYRWKGASLRGPWGINTMRRHISGCWKVINDCNAIADSDERFLGTLQGKYETIYARCDLHGDQRDDRRPPRRRLLWASRVAPEKRPELVARIAEELHAVGVDVSIDAYGLPDVDVSPEAVFGATSSVRYRGGFSSFSELPVGEFDAFLYTSSHDGLPNILLEALSSGLPVIAPDVGGIREVVIDGETGWLVDGEDDDALIHRYVDAVLALYRDWPVARDMSTRGQRLISDRHGSDAFSARVAEVLELDQANARKVA